MIVVSDTSPLNYLILIGQTEILPALFDRVVIPPTVLKELNQIRSPYPVQKWSGSLPTWLEIIMPMVIDDNLPLDLGETEAIGLAQELNADSLLLDERKATAVARRLGLEVTGTLGVLSLAAKLNLLELPKAIAALRQTNFRAPAEVVELLLQQDTERKQRSQRGT